MKQWKHPGKGDHEDQVLIYDRSPRVQSAIILPERKHNTRGLHNAWRASSLVPSTRALVPSCIPGGGGGGGEGRNKEQNKIKSDWVECIAPQKKSPRSLIATSRNLLRAVCCTRCKTADSDKLSFLLT